MKTRRTLSRQCASLPSARRGSFVFAPCSNNTFTTRLNATVAETPKSDAKKTLTFFVNGKKEVVTNIEPDLTLIDHLRNAMHLPGTKLACGEGGCGACTVTVSHFDKATGQVVHRSMNSCLVPLPYVEGMHVTTVEGIGDTKNLHPVQEKMAHLFGSQCGFCTPGFVMSLHSALKKNPSASSKELEKAIDGNLCRCTGYRPIIDAVRELSSDGSPKDAEYEKRLNSCEFPSELANYKHEPLEFKGKRSTWYRPTTLDDLLNLKQEHPYAKIVTGNTEVGIEQRFLKRDYPVLICPSNVEELNKVTSHVNYEGADHIEFGSAVNLSKIWELLKAQAAEFTGPNEHKRRGLDAIMNQLYWFSGTSIRNAASMAGNIMTASPISDLNPVFVACDAKFKLKSVRGERVVHARDFFLKGYRQVDAKPDEVLVSVMFPYSVPGQYIEAYKQSRRRDDDIAIVNSCINVTFDEESLKKKKPKVVEARLAFGGVATSTKSAPKTEAFLKGKEWNQQTFDAACEILKEEMALPENTPGGQEEYRSVLTLSFFYRYFLSVAKKLGLPDIVGKPEWKALESAATPLPFHMNSSGTQTIPPIRGHAFVGKNVVHASAERQVTGEAVYTDDVPRMPNELIGSLVTSTKPSAKIVKIDASKALSVPGVKGFFSSKDVPGDNVIGDIVHDEEVFASKEVHYVGEPIGLIVAEDDYTARYAAGLVEVQYEDLKPVYSINDAIEAESFFPNVHSIKKGDVETAFQKLSHSHDGGVVEGVMNLGGQEHFYFEPQTSIAYPADNEMNVLTSTQNLNKTQYFVASALGMPASKVTCSLKRIGGGFGGKETDNIKFACGASVAAYRTKRPVRIVLPRDVDMSITGKRHPFQAKYKVGYTKDGKLQAADFKLYSNGGAFHDLSWPVMDRALFHTDNAYRIPTYRTTGQICKTNTVSNTAFRGFGGPQGMFMIDNAIDHVATELGVEPEEIRKKNLYHFDDTTPYNMPVHVKLRELWEKCEETSDYARRRKDVEEFNKANRYRKRGMAMLPAKFGIAFTATFLNQASALVNVYTDGTVLITHGGVEMGQGLHTKVLQVAADALGVSMDKVYISCTATDKIPNASATAASMGSDLYCKAVLEACKKINEHLEPIKAQNVYGTFTEWVNAAYLNRIPLSAQAFFKAPVGGYDFETGRGKPFLYFTSGVAATEVEVDTLTGDYRALRSDVVMDVGRSINPSIDIGQIEGAFVQGQGWSTIEELIFGDNEHKWARPGFLKTNGPGAYKIPCADDIPREFNVTLMKDVDNPISVHSSRAIGEPPFYLGASTFFAIKKAIASARKDAGLSGYFHVDSPLTSERIRMACYDKLVASLPHNSSGDKLKSFRAKGSF